jgi:hypothetical protein
MRNAMGKSRLSTLSTLDLQREIVRRRRGIVSLERKREKLMKQLHAVEAAIREQGIAVGSSVGGKRPRNTANLADALAALLANATMSVTEAAEKVQEAGYRTTSPNFRTIVNQTFLKDKRFRRVSRGRYTAQGGRKSK